MHSFPRHLHWAVLAGVLVLRLHAATAGAPVHAGPANLRLTLPPVLYAVPGIEMSLYFSNTVLSLPGQQLVFSVTCPVGRAEMDRWVLIATPAQCGGYPLTIQVRDKSGHVLAKGAMRVQVAPASAGADRDLALLITGDSLTHASFYPNEVARLLSLPGNPRWQMLGTHKPAGAAPGVAHEGYGGWTWLSFNSRYDSAPPQPGKVNRSPFVFVSSSNPTPTLDVARYLKERCGGRSPDFVTFLLGINDCFGLKANDPKALDAGIDRMFQAADRLLTAFHQAAPGAELGVCLTTPPNVRDGAFEANYKGKYPRWNWRQVQHRIVERQLEHFSGRERDGIFVVPTGLNLDIVAGYPENNGVHPNAKGYQQIGASVYAWLKTRLAAQDAAAKAR